jgi:hypothetical protein
MTLDVYSGLFDDDIDGAAARLDEQLRRAEPPVEFVESARGVPVGYPTITNRPPRAAILAPETGAA